MCCAPSHLTTWITWSKLTIFFPFIFTHTKKVGLTHTPSLWTSPSTCVMSLPFIFFPYRMLVWKILEWSALQRTYDWEFGVWVSEHLRHMCHLCITPLHLMKRIKLFADPNLTFVWPRNTDNAIICKTWNVFRTRKDCDCLESTKT